MKKILFLVIISFLLISCSSNKNNYINDIYLKDSKSLDILMTQFAHNIENIWGLNEILIAGPKDFVKYTDQYKTRSHINFDVGTITFETIASNNSNYHLHRAITNTLIMGNDPKNIDLYSVTENIKLSNRPFLYDQILDHKNEPIRWQWRANYFASYLLQTNLQTRTTGKSKIWSITIKLVPNHMDKRARKYLGMVRKASQKYGVDQSLILAIIQTESSFNPYAVSNSDALGLMQIVQYSAGRDVFKMKGKWGQPSRSYLFDPQKNIDTGTAYLSLLQNSYLGGIMNPISRRYAVIAAYNGGASSVLRIFSLNQSQAFEKINRMHPDEVYEILYTKHPSIESRHYLYKVNNLHKSFSSSQTL